MNKLTHTHLTLLLAVVSSIVSGFLFTIEPLWLAGAVFGLLFALINFEQKLLAIPYAIASSVIYRIAIAIMLGVGNLSTTTDSSSAASSSSDLSALLAFAVAGLFGALALAVMTPILKKIPIAIGGLVRTTVIGAVAGLVFYLVIRFLGTGSTASIAIYLAYILWQVPVAWSLTTDLQKR